MISVLSAFRDGVGLGLAIAAPFGPINVEIVRRHLSTGIAAGLLLGLGACSVDTAYILLISFGLIAAAPGPRLQLWLAIAGAAILALLAGLILRSARSSAAVASLADASVAATRPDPQPLWRNCAVGIVMTATSPMNLVFWFGVIVSGASRSETIWGPWPRVAGVMCGTITWVAGLNLALARSRRFLRPRVLVGINIVSALALVGLAAWGVWKATRG
ncbi:MAG: LysE family transporter [Phycisphaerae bacterium]|nr:LysE family transporter [Phycisphaerae bacterium]